MAGSQPHCSLVQSGGAAHSPELLLPTPDGACEAERMEEHYSPFSREESSYAGLCIGLSPPGPESLPGEEGWHLCSLENHIQRTVTHAVGGLLTTSNLYFNPSLTAQPEVLKNRGHLPPSANEDKIPFLSLLTLLLIQGAFAPR